MKLIVDSWVGVFLLLSLLVIPAQAGIQLLLVIPAKRFTAAQGWSSRKRFTTAKLVIQPLLVIPAKAGIHFDSACFCLASKNNRNCKSWIPAKSMPG